MDCYPNVGEVVIVKELSLPRGSWKLGRVVRLINTEIDDVPRGAELTLSSGRNIKRPFKLLFPLESKEVVL